MDDVVVNKVESIRRCLARIREEYVGSEKVFEKNFTKQDAVVLNLQRACQASIDLGIRIIRLKKLPLPQTSSEVFALLSESNLLDAALSIRLQKMVGFRNIAVHNYEKVDLAILRSILDKHLVDFESFVQAVLATMNLGS